MESDLIVDGGCQRLIGCTLGLEVSGLRDLVSALMLEGYVQRDIGSGPMVCAGI